jgi:TPR repeat protein
LPPLKDPVEARSKTLLLLLLLLVLVCVAGGIYWWQAESAPSAARSAATGQGKAFHASPLLQRARELLRKGVSPEEAMELARGMQTPDGADGAFLLLEDAAQKGKPEAMLLLARFYDPTDAMPKGSIRPDPEQARDWYHKAGERGQEAAEGRLKALRAWAEAEKDKDPQARKLLESWK